SLRRLLRVTVPMRAKKASGLSMNRNSQTRMTNDEIRRNDETRMDETGACTTQRIWIFGLRICFVIRHSSFNDLCKSGSWSQCMREAKEASPSMTTLISHSPAETESFGEAWGRAADCGFVIGLIGELGAGNPHPP